MPFRSNPASSAQPFLKWAGGKWAIAEKIAAFLPDDAAQRRYREPFLGGGAMFFFLEPKRAVLSDTVADLVTTYRVVQNDVEALIKRLQKLARDHDEAHFYAIRERFNAERDASDLDRASWLVYLNKTCFNGLFRTNRSGEFNVPFGRYRAPRVADAERLRRASAALARAKIVHAPFDELLETAEAGDLVYLDPPYVPLSRTASFSAYADGGFGPEDQRRLADVFRKLDRRGCLLALSNSDTPVVRDLYAGFDIQTLEAPRVISSKVTDRSAVREVLVRNVKKYPR